MTILGTEATRATKRFPLPFVPPQKYRLIWTYAGQRETSLILSPVCFWEERLATITQLEPTYELIPRSWADLRLSACAWDFNLGTYCRNCFWGVPFLMEGYCYKLRHWPHSVPYFMSLFDSYQPYGSVSGLLYNSVCQRYYFQNNLIRIYNC